MLASDGHLMSNRYCRSWQPSAASNSHTMRSFQASKGELLHVNINNHSAPDMTALWKPTCASADHAELGTDHQATSMALTIWLKSFRLSCRCGKG